MAVLLHPEDLNFLPPLAITRHSHLGSDSMSLVACMGSMTNEVVDIASASIAVRAMTDTLVLNSGDSPVLGSTMWWNIFSRSK